MNDSISYMQRALQLAALALGRTSPNPVVGSVVVKDGKIIGEGYHKKAGTPHAEVLALQEAGEAARGASLYVTLEPCDHKGKTPPCTQAIINAGIKKVFVATLDPNPLVSGKGIKRLREAGIEVCTGLLEREAQELNEFFFKYITQGKPFLALKTAMSIDGKIATRNGDSRWVTNEKSRLFVHELRDTYDAILVGVGTILRDDPMLNTRLPKNDARSPVRLVIDGRLETPIASQVVRTAHKQKTIMYTCSRAEKARIEELKSLGVEVVVLGEQPGRIPLEEVLKDVAQKGLMSVLLESGGRINAYAIENKLVDKVYWFIAPKIIGGETAMSPVAGTGIDHMHNALKLNNIRVRNFDDDLLVVGYL
ncbi:MAG: bifunctional diaminohydroxyphosphoribosylaminopyrimidine deaminase/5-amino-6-(5-phosphoribosylamino)uracil reductase RibD [Candidatus Saccharibacteria bacterium]